ncbi:MAG: hypothetical protein HY820_45625 [Acidobacteria bacterium]|nr:hypothetical protein [Acidobacteriota bacterium]
MPLVRIYQKKQIRLDRLNLRQNQMFKIGNVGVAAVKNRVGAALGPEDSPARPLTKRYAIGKTRLGKGNRRNLTFTGDMLRNFMVRTVSENKAKASLSTRKDRIKAWVNQKIEAWAVFSPKNKEAVLEAARRVVNEMKDRLLVERMLGGKQR